MKKWDLIYTFLITVPILDLLSSISNRITDSFFSAGMIIKGLAIIIGIIYVIFISSSRKRKITLWYFGVILVYLLFYFSFKPDLLYYENFLREINNILRFIYFPIMLFTFLNVFDEKDFPKNLMNKILFVSLIIYIIFITIPTILNINFSSYSNTAYAGSVGWYYAANEISTILLLLFPFIFILKEKNKIIILGLFLLSLYTISLIGTKVTLFGILIVTFLIFISSLIKNKKLLNKNVCFTFIMFIVTILFMFNNYAATNMKSSLTKEEEIEIVNIKQELEVIEENYQKNNTYLKLKEISSKLLSSRDVYALNTFHIYNTSYKADYLWFGMGFINTNRINNSHVEKLIEIDFLDTFFHLGLLGIIILAFPFFYTSYYFIKNRNKYKFNEDIFMLTLIILLTVGISSTAGHVFLAPSVSIYVAIYFCYLFNELNLFQKKKIKSRKISILALHLGYGGVENVISNVANMLSDNFEVEIIAIYKKEQIPFKISNKVRIKYITNTCSNREEFNNALKSKKIMSIFKEGLKSIYILVNKKRWIKKAIIYNDARVVISTRIEFSKILNEYGRNEIIRIHQEHTYKVENDYINLLNQLVNIDYIMPVSIPLLNAYQNKVKIKLKYIPLCLSDYPKEKEISKLNSNNLIAIGRLEKEKGFNDLMKVISKIENEDVYLNIFGDGSEMEYLKSLAKELGIYKKIKFWGYRSPRFISKYLKKSSLYIMTSLEESFGLVLIEAMSYGVPCIAFDSAKGATSIIDDSCGYIVKDRNIDEMANIIDSYLKMSLKEKRKLGKNARTNSKKYEFNNIKKEWLNFMNEVIK